MNADRAKSEVMRLATAERIRDGKGWYWPPNARKAHYYDADNRTLCGTGFVLRLPDAMDGIDAGAGPDDCAGCRRKVDAARARLAMDDAVRSALPKAEGDL